MFKQESERSNTNKPITIKIATKSSFVQVYKSYIIQGKFYIISEN